MEMSATTDFPGKSGLRPEAMSDRLAILNLVGAYAYFANIGDIERWANLFHGDATFLVSGPGVSTEAMSMDKVLETRAPLFAAVRRALAEPGTSDLKVYHFGPPFIRRQTGAEAELITNLVQFRIPAGGETPVIQLTALYTGELVKEDRDWKIIRWAATTSRRPALPGESAAFKG